MRFLAEQSFDYLFSIANPRILSPAVLALPTGLAINFHDALLPRDAGVHATAWAVLHRATYHGVSWHVMTAQTDAGDLLAQRSIPMDHTDTSYTLNLKCLQAGVESFTDLVEDLASGRVTHTVQDLRNRTYHARTTRPRGALTISWHQSAEDIDASVRATQFGPHPNEFGTVKLAVGAEKWVIVGATTVSGRRSTAPAGSVLAVTEQGMTVATVSHDLSLAGLRSMSGTPIAPAELALRPGHRLPELDPGPVEALTVAYRDAVSHERYWVERLAELTPLTLPLPESTGSPDDHGALPVTLPEWIKNLPAPDEAVFAALLGFLTRVTGETEFDVGLRQQQTAGVLGAVFASTVPFRAPATGGDFPNYCREVSRRLHATRAHGTYPRDITTRYPRLHTEHPQSRQLPITVEFVDDLAAPATFEHDTALLVRITHTGQECDWSWAGNPAGLLRDNFTTFLDGLRTHDPDRPISRMDILTAVEREWLVVDCNDTAVPLSSLCLPELFQTQVVATPQAVAVVFGEVTLSYAQLNAAANRLAHWLIGLGVGPEQIVGLALPRSPDLVIAILAVLKAGAGYLPLDPDYPAERLAFMIRDARPVLLLTSAQTTTSVPDEGAPPRWVIDDPDTVAVVGGYPDTDPTDTERTAPVISQHPAYVIYTSGSTGRPKGVLVCHAGVPNLAAAQIERFSMDARSRVLQFASPSFDASVAELWGALLSGAALILAPTAELLPGTPLIALLAEQRVTHVTLPPSVLAVLPAQDGVAPAVTVVVAGEACPADLVASWSPNRRMINAYGPTETTVCATISEPLSTTTRTPVPIGRPITNTRVYVLDSALQPVPRGVAGELYIAGAGLARGYLRQAGLTAQRFVANPFGPPGDRMYRTGDLARWRVNGDLEFAGRIDDQIKIRGFRIEPAEIETVLAAHPDVTHAAVIARQDQPDDKRLVAYVVPATDTAFQPDLLRDYLRERLPGYMVPAAVVVLEGLPLTANGKLDRGALPAPEFGSGGAGQGPRTPQEQLLAELFAEVLGLAGVGVNVGFFDLGGNSLLAIRLIARIRATLGVELGLRALFEAPTVAGVAAALHDAGQARLALTACERPDVVPLSFAQRRLWFLHQMEGPSATYNIPLALRLSGKVDREALQAALGDVVARHESLRTIFPQLDNVPYQQVLDVQNACPQLTVTETTETELPEVLAAAAKYGFDLATEPPMRAELFALAPDEQVLLVVVHHIASDGWSIGPLSRDLATAYQARCRGEAPGWAPLPVQYADYTLWQHQLLGDHTDSDSLLATQLAYWTDTLTGLPEQLQLPTDRSRPSVASFRGDSVTVRLDAALHQRLRELARQSGASLFMVLQAGLVALLSRMGAGSDIAVGSPIAGRTDQALDDLVGFFVNTLVLRTDTSGDPTFGELLARVRETALAAYAHPDVPFEYLVEVLNPTRSLAHNPLFQVLLAVQHTPEVDFELPGLDTSFVPAPTGTAKFDLAFSLFERRGAQGDCEGIDGAVGYASDLFDPATVETIATRWVRLLEAAVADPDRPISRIDILTAAEREWLVVGCNDTAVPVSQVCLPVLFQRQVVATPQAVAVVFGELTLSYAQLNAAANRLAHRLIGLGVGPERIVALALPRSPDLVIAVLAVLKAGAGYLSLDPDYPAERIAFMLHDAQPVLLLTSAQTTMSVPDEGAPPRWVMDDPDSVAVVGGCRDTDPTDADRITPLVSQHPAYVIYTSGSTGHPKGVVLSHAGVPNLATAQIERFSIDARSRVLQFASPSFDASVAELWGALLSGAALVLAPTAELLPGTPLIALLAEQRVTHVTLPPSALAVLPVQDGVAPAVTVVVAGEACSADLVASWSPNHRMINAYGPTETTVCATLSDPLSTTTRTPVPIGKPIINTRVYVLDSALQPVPPGVAGELYIAGAGLARGYLRQAGLTAQRFVANPFGPPGERMYRTGDLARWRVNGDLEFAGRIDDQIKIRGFRIEPAEIETQLMRHPQVTEAVVAARDDGRGHRILLGYVVCDGEAPEPAELEEFLRARVPGYLVPSVFVGLDKMPLTANGKVDRKALPAPDPARIDRDPEFAAPVTAEQRVIASVWAQVLGLDRVGRHTDFFSLGGHSLLVPQITARLRDLFGVEVPIRTFLEQPTVAGLSSAISRAREAGSPLATPANSEGDTSAALAERDAQLPRDLTFHPAPPTTDTPRSILLTGATGFVGAFLLSALLRHTSATVHCLVRAANDAAADERLHLALHQFGLVADPNRVIAVPADLSLPTLGVTPHRLERLARQIDTIVHCGASVTAMRGYRHLRGTNVHGTRELLRLTAECDIRAFHYISSTSAARPGGTGYSLSKWAAEQLVMAAARRGLTASVYRLPRVLGASDSGVWNESDAMARMIRGSIALGAFPALGTRLDEIWVPVDAVSEIISSFVRRSREPAGLSMLSADPVSYADVLAWTRSFGYSFEVLPATDWLSSVAEDPRNPAHLVAGMVLNPPSSSTAERSTDTLAADETTRDEGFHTLPAPPVSEDMFHRILHRLIQDGLLPAPTDR
ncbi:MAG: amino acid adenylation domain-containing protein [Pseudonocardiaceae bacterium]